MLLLLSVLTRSLLALLRSRRDLTLENVVLRHQLQVALRTNPSPRLTKADRVLWVWLRGTWPAWRDHLQIVEPETVPIEALGSKAPCTDRWYGMDR